MLDDMCVCVLNQPGTNAFLNPKWLLTSTSTSKLPSIEMLDCCYLIMLQCIMYIEVRNIITSFPLVVLKYGTFSSVCQKVTLSNNWTTMLALICVQRSFFITQVLMVLSVR